MYAGRWKQVNTVLEYIEASERFRENTDNNVRCVPVRSNDMLHTRNIFWDDSSTDDKCGRRRLHRYGPPA